MMLLKNEGEKWPEILTGVLLRFFCIMISFLYCFEHLWGRLEKPVYALTALLGFACILLVLFYNKLYKEADVWFLSLAMLWSAISAIYNNGFSVGLFLSKNWCAWMVIVSGYFVIRAAKNPLQRIYEYMLVSVVGLFLVNLFVLLHATKTLMPEVPERDLLYGSFQMGRLCGLTNANVMTFAGAALFLFSIGCCIVGGKRRVIFGITAALGWFNVGLTNCRTAMIGVSFAVAVYVFLLVLARINQKQVLQRILWVFMAAAAFFAVLVLTYVSFYVPFYLYRWVVGAYASITHNTNLARNLAGLTYRTISDDDGTLTDRTIIWKKTLEWIFFNRRRTWFGISFAGTERVWGVYEGRHDIGIINAHNSYLELFRRVGIPGFLLWMGLLVHWGIHGIRAIASNLRQKQICFVFAATAGILLMGCTEQIPFLFEKTCFFDIPFFMFCALSIRFGRTSCSKEE